MQQSPALHCTLRLISCVFFALVWEQFLQFVPHEERLQWVRREAEQLGYVLSPSFHLLSVLSFARLRLSQSRLERKHKSHLRKIAGLVSLMFASSPDGRPTARKLIHSREFQHLLKASSV